MNKYLVIGLVLAGVWLWRRGQQSIVSGMTLSEAARLLDIPAHANAETIIAAHKRLISRVHPDTGGSAELASRVNQARDVMLKRLTP